MKISQTTGVNLYFPLLLIYILKQIPHFTRHAQEPNFPACPTSRPSMELHFDFSTCACMMSPAPSDDEMAIPSTFQP